MIHIDQLPEYVARITAGCPCDDCQLRHECARTGKECADFKRYIAGKSTNSKRGRHHDARG